MSGPQVDDINDPFRSMTKRALLREVASLERAIENTPENDTSTVPHLSRAELTHQLIAIKAYIFERDEDEGFAQEAADVEQLVEQDYEETRDGIVF